MPFRKQKTVLSLRDESASNLVTEAFASVGDKYTVQHAANEREIAKTLNESDDCWLVLQPPSGGEDLLSYVSALPLGPRHCVLLLIEPGEEHLAFGIESPARVVPVTAVEPNLVRLPDLVELAFKEVEFPVGSSLAEAFRFTGRPTAQPKPYLGKTIERIGCGIVITDPRQYDNPIVYCNDAFLSITGYERAEVLGRNCRFLQCECESLEERQMLREAIKAGHHCAVVLRNRRKNGEQYWNELSIAPIFEQDELIYFIGVTNDVTSRRTLESDLAISSTRLKLALEASHTGAWYRNALTDEVFFDERGAEIFGIDWEVARSGVPQQMVLDLIHEGDMPMVEELLERLDEPSTKFSHEIRISTPEGYKWVLASGVVECDREQRVVATRGICMNIDERKTNRMRIRELETQLEHMNRITSMSEMVAVLAHELSQPLLAISSSAAAIQIDSAKHNTSWDLFATASADIADQVQRAGNIVSSLRKFVGNASPSTTIGSLNETIRDVVQFVSGQIRLADVAIELDLADGLPELYFDELQISQVLINLIQNAIDAMQGEAVRCRELKLETSEAGGRIRCRVFDTGVGVPAELCQRQFEPFVTTKEHGLGMGLRICETIVTNHGGELEYETNQPAGSIFTIELPIADV